MTNDTLCSIEGCPRHAHSRGWCMTHYMNWNLHGDPEYADKRRAMPKPTECTATDCSEPPEIAGMCQMHYHRNRRSGDTGPAGRLRKKPETILKDGTWKAVLAAVNTETDNCIIRTFSLGSKYGGVVMPDGTNTTINRAICIWVYGPPPKLGLEAAHWVCGNPLCMNKRHLRWSTGESQHEDKIRHGTAGRGDTSPNHKLTEHEVREIRERHTRDKISQNKLAIEYNVSRATVGKIISRQTWKHI